MRCSLFKWLTQKCTVSLQQDEIQFASTTGDCLLLMGEIRQMAIFCSIWTLSDLSVVVPYFF